MPKATKAEKAQKAREKKERKALEAAIKAAKEKVEDGKLLLHPAPNPETGKTPAPNLTKAGAAFDAAAELHADNPDAYLYRGDVRRDQRQWAEAIDDYGRAIALYEGQCVPAFQGRATCFEALGQWDRAIDDHSAVIDLEPHGDHAYNRRGAALLQKKVPTIRLRNRDFEAVEEDLEQALRLNPHNYHARCNLARLYDEHDMFDKANEEYTKAMGLCENYSHAMYRRACCTLRGVETARAKLEDEAFEARAACGIADHGADADKGGFGAASPKAVEEAPVEDPAALVAQERAAEKHKTQEHRLLLRAMSDFQRLLPEEDPHTELPAFVHHAECLFMLGKLMDAYNAFTAALKALDGWPNEEGIPKDELVICGTPAVVLRGILDMRMPVLKRRMEAAGISPHGIGSLSL